jgi:heme-degrading monooxygenase HmoA
MAEPAEQPEPPYFAVIFANQRTAADPEGYEAMADAMVELARRQPGYLGIESTRGPDGFGITVSYWADESSIAAWRADVDHTAARELGRERWYEHYSLRVARVERAYGFHRPPDIG